MNKNRQGILINSAFELEINPVRDASGMIVSGIVVGSSIDQDAYLVLKLRQGELKEDPLLGCGLTKFIRGKYNAADIETNIREHLTRAGIDYNDYMNRIQLTIK